MHLETLYFTSTGWRIIRSNEGELQEKWQEAPNTTFHSGVDVKVELTTENEGSSLHPEGQG